MSGQKKNPWKGGKYKYLSQERANPEEMPYIIETPATLPNQAEIKKQTLNSAKK